MPGTVADPPSVSLSCRSALLVAGLGLTFVVANNFWGKEDAGVQPLLERMHNAKTTCDELKSFYSSMIHLGRTDPAYG